MDIANVSVRRSLVNLYAPSGGVDGVQAGGWKRGEMGICVNVFVSTNLVNFMRRVGEMMRVRKARRLFVEMADRNMVSWNALVVGYVRCRDVDKAWRIFMRCRRGMLIRHVGILQMCLFGRVWLICMHRVGELMGCKQVDGREDKWVLRKCVCVDEFG